MAGVDRNWSCPYLCFVDLHTCVPGDSVCAASMSLTSNR
jgi:hypothetical protein